LLIFDSDFHDSVLAVKTHTDRFISLNKLVKFLGQVLILQLQHSDVIVESIDLSLEVSVRIEKSGVIVTSVVELFAKLDNLIFSDSDFSFKILNESGKLCISETFLIDSSLDVCILRSVSLIKRSQVIQFLLVARLLVFKFMQLILCFNKCCLLILKLEGFVIKNTSKFINSCQSLRNVVFNSSDLSRIISALFGLQVTLAGKFVNLVGIFSVSLS
jgi:hypothetical protein